MHLRYALDHAGYTDGMVAVIGLARFSDISRGRLRSGVYARNARTWPRSDRL